MVSKIQSILFSVESWTKAQAMRWLHSHNYKYDKCFESRHYFHFQQLEPSFKHYVNKTITMNNGIPSIEFVMGSNDAYRGGDLNEMIQDELSPLGAIFGIKSQHQQDIEDAQAEAARQALIAKKFAESNAAQQASVSKFENLNQSQVEQQLMKLKALVDNSANNSSRVMKVSALNRWMLVALNKYPTYFTPEYFKSVGLIKQDYLPYKNGKFLKFMDLGLGSLDKYMGSGRGKGRY